jgi:hypothetical protein
MEHEYMMYSKIQKKIFPVYWIYILQSYYVTTMVQMLTGYYLDKSI